MNTAQIQEAKTSPLAGTYINMSELDIKHKREFEELVRAEPNGENRAFMVELFDKWHLCNREYLQSELLIPTYITLSVPHNPRAIGCYSSESSWGGKSEISIRPSLFSGKHKSINPSAPMEGRKRYIFDILLHEMVRQYCIEKQGKPESGNHGHGPIFRDQCNRISDILGIAQRVRSNKKTKRDRHLPSCAQWPHNVRPPDYYMGAIKEGQPGPEAGRGSQKDPIGHDQIPVDELLKFILGYYSGDDVHSVVDSIWGELIRGADTALEYVRAYHAREVSRYEMVSVLARVTEADRTELLELLNGVSATGVVNG